MRAGRIEEIGIALGGIAAKPWRASKAEAALRGGPATAQACAAALADELADAAPLPGNVFKIALAQRTLGAVLADLSGSDR
jgi:xanthine dehydrogenase YagS FAD-binding subunit